LINPFAYSFFAKSDVTNALLKGFNVTNRVLIDLVPV